MGYRGELKGELKGKLKGELKGELKGTIAAAGTFVIYLFQRKLL